MDLKLNVLILEDIEYDAELIQYELRKAGILFDATVVFEKEKYSKLLFENPPDVILADHTLPQFNSVEALEMCKEAGLDAVFILVTGTVSEEFAVSIIHMGADDYILKDSLKRLPSAITNALEKKKAEKQSKLVLETLKIKNTELEAINEELDHLVYSASHDLRSPLTSILGLINIIKIEMDINNIHDYVKLMEATVSKLDKVIRDIVNYSDNRRKDVENSEIDLEEILIQIYDELKIQYEGRAIQFSVNTQSKATFYSDRKRLEIIFSHIISNALIFSNPEQAIINVDLNINNEYASIVFKDNGIGIPEIHIPRIFDMFFKANIKSKGSGLGLYIVKESLRKLKGSINVNSSHGAGSTFILTIPNN